MAKLTIRNLVDDLKSLLRMQAASHGQSMEDEARSILRLALRQPAPAGALGQRLFGRFQAVAGELPMAPRSLPRLPPDWQASA